MLQIINMLQIIKTHLYECIYIYAYMPIYYMPIYVYIHIIIIHIINMYTY